MEELIRQRVERAIKEKVFPGCVIGYIKNGKKAILPFGHVTYDLHSRETTKDTLYDVASVTKSIPTSSLVLSLLDRRKISLDDRVISFLPQFKGKGKEDVTLKHLLTYSLDLDLPPLSTLRNVSPDYIIDLIYNAPLRSKPGEKFLYLNATAMLLGLVVKAITNKDVAILGEEYFFGPLGMERTTFSPQKFSLTEIAPTEGVYGIVHDESTRILQKQHILGASGLFSTVSDLLTFMEMLVQGGELRGEKFFSENSLTMMQTGLGWELFGEYQAFGKTGFTGCLVLANLPQKIALVLLSNRIHPQRPEDSSEINKVRTDLLRIVFGS